MVCVPIDPNTAEPLVYAIDPASVQSLLLVYQTRTKGNINIVESPNAKETRVLLKLQRQFYQMKDRQDVTGFQIETLPNSTARFELNDVANRQRVFFISSVLCSDSILTIEMPRVAVDQPDLSIDATFGRQDVYINLDESMPRNASWRFKGISNNNLFVQSLNINALSITYTSTLPSTLTLASVIVRDRLSVLSVNGDIQASVGFTFDPSPSSSPSNSSSPTTVNLNTLDGHIQLDMKAWNQSCTFQVNSPEVELIKAGQMVLSGNGGLNNTIVSVNGLMANTGINVISGTYTPFVPPSPSTSSGTTQSGTALPTSTVTEEAPHTTTDTPKLSGVPTSTILAGAPRSTLGAGGSPVPAHFMIQANKNVVLRFP
ncbi:hypothetical protein BGZ65_005104 [Modicella reniformis]|uniref:Adhesin domain-containing protein n=1 Tax=Modicella reniformis TaxID=1440133 RepID=A0A9P6SVL9_9FUNG|nr:hypothetical protein BGZ65_005104 [Modicella reniformis]